MVWDPVWLCSGCALLPGLLYQWYPLLWLPLEPWAVKLFNINCSLIQADMIFFKNNAKKGLTECFFSCIIRRSSRETVWVSSGSFFLIFENWSVRKFRAGLKQDFKEFKKRYASILAYRIITGEFDPGSEWTLAACLTHASRTRKGLLAILSRVAHGWVTRR